MNRLAAAVKLGVDWGSLRDWEDGTARPGLDAAVHLQTVCNIPVSAWAKTKARAKAKAKRSNNAA